METTGKWPLGCRQIRCCREAVPWGGGRTLETTHGVMPAELSRRPLSQALVELTPWETAGGCGAPKISLGSFLLELSGTSV